MLDPPTRITFWNIVWVISGDYLSRSRGLIFASFYTFTLWAHYLNRERRQRNYKSQFDEGRMYKDRFHYRLSMPLKLLILLASRNNQVTKATATSRLRVPQNECKNSYHLQMSFRDHVCYQKLTSVFSQRIKFVTLFRNRSILVCGTSVHQPERVRSRHVQWNLSF